MNNFAEQSPSHTLSKVVDRIPTAYPRRFIERRIRFLGRASALADAQAQEPGYYIEAHPFALNEQGEKVCAQGWHFGLKGLVAGAEVFSPERLDRFAETAPSMPIAHEVLKGVIAMNGIIMPAPARPLSEIPELEPLPPELRQRPTLAHEMTTPSV